MLYAGRLVEYKGCDYLLRAMKLVRQQRPEARLVVIGDGPFRPLLEQLNGELGVGATFLGEHPQPTIKILAGAVPRVLCPQSQGQGRHERSLW